MKRIIKGLAGICALLMGVVILSVSARADEPVGIFSDLQTLIDSATSGDTIVLYRDYVGGLSYISIASKTITIDLNGHKIDRNLTNPTSFGYVIGMGDNCTLNLLDTKGGGIITGGNNSNGPGGGIYIYGTNSTLNMYGGTITGNIANSSYNSQKRQYTGNGGGICFKTGPSYFNMYGGSIEGNTAGDGPGGIGECYSGYSQAVIKIYGGTIKNNFSGNKINAEEIYGKMYVSISGGTVEGEINVNELLKITSQPSSTSANVGDTVCLSTSAETIPSGTVTFQWYKVNEDGSEEAIDGATESTYTFVFREDETYYCQVAGSKINIKTNIVSIKTQKSIDSDNRESVIIDHDTFKTEVPTKTVLATKLNNKIVTDMKVHSVDDVTRFNQLFLMKYYIGLGATEIKTTGIYPIWGVKSEENGEKRNLVWTNLNYAGEKGSPIEAVVYNSTDGAYIMHGTFDGESTAVFYDFIYRPASNITIAVK